MNLPLNLREMQAAAMLLGEDIPKKCDNCNGTGCEHRVLGFGTCHWCRGRGITGISLKIWDAMGFDRKDY